MKSTFIPGVLLAVCVTTGHAAVQTFVDHRQELDGTPVTVTATLTDPYSDTKPIQRYGDFTYWYTAGPSWRSSTATVTNGFTASLDFTVNSPDLNAVALSVQTGLSVYNATGPVQYAGVETTLSILNPQSQVVYTHTFTDEVSPGLGGYGEGVSIPSAVGQHFIAEVTFHFTSPSTNTYLFNGFAVDTRAVPEPESVALTVAGLMMVGVLRRR